MQNQFKADTPKLGITKHSFGLVYLALLICVFMSPIGMTQDFGENSDLQDSELSLSLSTTINFGGALGGSITIGQYGLFNTTNIIQAGSDSNTIEVIQQGNNNRAEVTQLGIDNKVFLLQQGENNLFSIIQDGNGNTANVNQLGEQRFIVTQIGNEMVVNITQYNN
jgi:minor curlin subunit